MVFILIIINNIVIVIAIVIVINLMIRLEVVGTQPLKVLDICSVALLQVAIITIIIIILIHINTSLLEL